LPKDAICCIILVLRMRKERENMTSNVIALRSNPQLVEFRNYVLSFYAYDSVLYPIADLTVAKVETAIQEYLKLVVSDKNHFEWGYGDSLDRERVRDILLKDYHMMKLMSEAA
jgi:hypothetical protein